MRCGLFPVFSNCSMTAMTMSSLMPSVSILRVMQTSPGEGGGVYSFLILCGKAVGISAGGERVVDRGEETGDGGWFSS